MKKLLNIFVAVCFIFNSSMVFASSDTKFYVINDLSKGQNSHISIYKTPDNQMFEATNVRVNDSYSSLSKREAMISSVDYGATSINGIHRFYKSDATTKTVIATSTLLRADFSDTATTIKTGLSDGKWWQFVTYQDKAIGGNDTDLPIKYDGHTQVTANTDGSRTAGELCAELGAPFAELNTGTDLDAASWYMYKIAWYDGSTYSYSTARSNPILTGAAVHEIYLTDIPIGPTGTTHRYIYRTLGGADQATVEADTTYYLVDSIADNSTQVYADSETDGDIDDDNAPTWTTASGGTNATPPVCPILTIHNERLFMSGNTTNKSDIYWSDEYNPDYFNVNTDYEAIRPDDGDEVTFLKNQLGILTVGKTNTIQRYYTDKASDSDWYVSDPFSYEGCPAPYSAANTPKGIFYLSWDGLRNYNGQNSNLISDAVTDVIKDISRTDIATTVGHYHEGEYHLSYTSSASGASTNDRTLVYDLIRDAYVVDTKSINCYASFNSGTDIGTLYSGSSTTDGYVFAHTGSSSIVGARYKSDFDAGTFDDAMSYATENNPRISMESLDRMESYTTTTLARADWVTGETTEKIPPDLGEGTDGAKTVSADEDLSAGEYNYTSLTVDAGMTLTILGSADLKCLDDVTVNGTIELVGGTLNIYAVNITVGAAGTITTDTSDYESAGTIVLRANTITVTTGGLIEENITNTVAGGSVSSSGGNYGSNSNVWDGNWETKYGWENAGGHTSNTIYSTVSFDSIGISKVKYDIRGGNAPEGGQAVGYVQIYYSAAWHTLASASCGPGGPHPSGGNYAVIDTDDTGWAAVTSYRAYSTQWDTEELEKASVYHYELTIYGEPRCDYINSTGVTASATDVTDFVNALECYSENDSVNVNEGTYALKIICANGAITLDDTIVNTITSIDLSAATHDTILLDIKASRAGTNIQLGIDEVGGDYSGSGKLQDITVSSENEWETLALDFSSVTDANKNAIVLLALKFTDTDATNIVYIDNIRPALTSATWTSPIYEINAETLDKLYWNEELTTYGNVTMQIRLDGDTDFTGIAWNTAVTTPTGSDQSSITANTYIQFRINFTTTNAYFAPYVYQADGYVFRLVYSKIGDYYETSVPSVFQTGWKDFQIPGYKKFIRRIKIFYHGTGGVLTFNMKGDDDSQMNKSFNIDLSVSPNDSTTDKYTGEGLSKVYTWHTPINSAENPSPISELWRFTVSEDGTTVWSIDRIQIAYDVEELY